MKDSEDMTKYRTSGDSTKGSVKVEDVDNEDNFNGSTYDADSIMGVDGRYPKRQKNQ